jgi:hypothetical protein
VWVTDITYVELAGGDFCYNAYGQRLANVGIERSATRKGDSYYNALATEVIDRERFMEWWVGGDTLDFGMRQTIRSPHKPGRSTPIHLMGFLEDARQRKVLRTVGPIYQFRHARLQDRLATQNEKTTNTDTADNQVPSITL